MATSVAMMNKRKHLYGSDVVLAETSDTSPQK